MSIQERQKDLRQILSAEKIDAYIVPGHDPHLSEYVPEYWKERAWISGFTGSAGLFALTSDQSGLWTDGRYFIQAEKQLADSEIRLFRQNTPGYPDYPEWLCSQLQPGRIVGVAGELISIAAFDKLAKALHVHGIVLKSTNDLLSTIWSGRPALPAAAAFEHLPVFAGITAAQKIEQVRLAMRKAGADAYLLSSLDDLAWLFNIRGYDIAFVPVVTGYALITMEQAVLFIPDGKLPHKLQQNLKKQGVAILPYQDVFETVGKLKKRWVVGFDPLRTNARLASSLSDVQPVLHLSEITSQLKGIKNETELANLRHTQIKEGLVMVRFLMWLEKTIRSGPEVTEWDASEKLRQLRETQPDQLGPSFATIAAYQANGAMMHYMPIDGQAAILQNKGLMVVDSGGQYLGGTTDVTRTIVFDQVSEAEKVDFTLVLQSHIALATAKFLTGTPGSNLDVLARKPMWDRGLDYKSGTGHGVGYCLSVHEGPHRISQIPNTAGLEAGMIVTIEPGIYREGQYGIRTENMVVVVTDRQTSDGQFLRFEPLTWCPISVHGLKIEQMTVGEIAWLNDYHRQVYDNLSPHLSINENLWLKDQTRAIEP